MSPRRRLSVLWFSAGVLLPLVFWGLGALLNATVASEAFMLMGTGSFPFWLFLWIPAMGHPDNEILFYSVLAGLLLANGALYLVMAYVQTRTRDLKLPLRLAALAVAYPALMALGYCVPLGLELLI